MEPIFEKMNETHGKEVLDIFNYYIENSFAAYPATKLPYSFFDRFLEMPNGYPSYVIKNKDTKNIIGFCFLKAYNPLPTFKETAEITYFIAKDSVGAGIGKAALNLLEKDAQNLGVKYLLANISSKNEQSLNFHKNNGFSECGRLNNIGRKNDENFDVVYMEKTLENLQ